MFLKSLKGVIPSFSVQRQMLLLTCIYLRARLKNTTFDSEIEIRNTRNTDFVNLANTDLLVSIPLFLPFTVIGTLIGCTLLHYYNLGNIQ